MAEDLANFLLTQLRRVQVQLGVTPLADDCEVCFADALDSMGFAEFLAVVAGDCSVPVDQIAQASGRHFSSVAALAEALAAAGVAPCPESSRHPAAVPLASAGRAPLGWLTGVHTVLPRCVESAASLDRRLGQPPGWFAEHTGIAQRVVWGEEDPLAAAASAAHGCLDRSEVLPGEVGALLVTSEAPPVALGLAAALHHRLRLPSTMPALEIGGACAGFLAALWTAVRLLSGSGSVLIVAVEAATRWLTVEPGPAGEAAALFGDAAGACLLAAQPRGVAPLALRDVALGADGSVPLAEVCAANGRFILKLAGPELAARAVQAMVESTRSLGAKNGLRPEELAAVVVHAGNGRMPAIIARRLGVDAGVVKSQTPWTGNLGSASLPVAWCALAASPAGPVVWTAAAAGAQWGAALFLPS